MNSSLAHAVVIDPFSSGQFLVDEFDARGIPCVAVLTNKLPPLLGASFRPEKYAAVLDACNDVDALADRLAAFRPTCVMTGIETGIELMDGLAARLGLPGNDPATSALRRDKYLMNECLRTAGIRSAAQSKVGSVAEADGWLQSHGIYPVVVKPSLSAGSDNVHICADRAEALVAVAAVLGARSLFGVENDGALVQEFLEGPEWVVDTVSCGGRDVVTNVTKYRKQLNEHGQRIYRHSAFLAPDADEHGPLLAYARSVLNALGVAHGSAHVELIWTERGPVLVELNARMHGGDAVSMLRRYAPYTQLDLSVDAHVAPAAFAAKADVQASYDKHVVAHFLVSSFSGELQHVVEEERLTSLQSYVGKHLPRKGDRVRMTESLTTSPGYLWLAHESRERLQSDQDVLVDWEERGLLFC